MPHSTYRGYEIQQCAEGFYWEHGGILPSVPEIQAQIDRFYEWYRAEHGGVDPVPANS